VCESAGPRQHAEKKGACFIFLRSYSSVCVCAYVCVHVHVCVCVCMCVGVSE